MKPIHRYLIRALACLILAAGGYFGATSMIDSLYAYRSPIKDTPPAPGERIGPPATRRVVMVLIDGLRYDTAQDAQVMPTLAKLRQQGASARMHSQTPSFSEPGYSTLLTGGWSYLNDGPIFNIDYANIPAWTQDNLYSSAARAGLKTAVSGYYWFEKLIPQNAVTAHFYTSGEDRAADRAVVDAALPWLDDPAYALVLVHLDQVDYAGHHEGGAKSPHWAAAAARADAQVAEILGKLDLTKDTIAVFSDHGHVDQGGHGGQDPVVLVEPLVLAGAGVRPGNGGGEKTAGVQMVDFAPTIAALLGLNLPADSQGRVLTGMLALPQETLLRLNGLTIDQQQALVTGYTKAIHSSLPIPQMQSSTANESMDSMESVAWWQAFIDQAREKRMQPEMAGRGLLALLIAAVPAFFFLRSRPRGWGWLVLGALVILAVFNFRYAVLSSRVYSFSALISVTDMVIYCATTVGIAFTIAWLVTGWKTGVLGSRPMEAAQSALNLALVTAWFLGLFVLVHFTVNGLFASWTVPDALTFYLALLSMAQLIMVAGYGLAFSGVSALIGWLASSKQAQLAAAPGD